jgi:hypothetical protein
MWNECYNCGKNYDMGLKLRDEELPSSDDPYIWLCNDCEEKLKWCRKNNITF